MARLTGEDRRRVAEQALELYNKGATIMEVATQLEMSYGKTHALIKEAGGTPRARGSRRPEPEPEADHDEEE